MFSLPERKEVKIVKRAIIFGATGGIGQAISRELAAHGWSLYVHCCHQWAKAKQICQELRQTYPRQDFMPVELNFVTDNQHLKEFVDQLLPVNALIFAQGVTEYGLLAHQKLAAIEAVLNIDLAVPIKLTRLFEPTLVKQSFSRIVYLGSVYGGQGSALETVYSAAKAGLSRFSQAYAREVAFANLTVNVIAPGAVATPMNSSFSAQAKAKVRAEIPVGRWARGADISFWVNNLLDERSSYCTGQTIYVTGGWLV